MGEMSVLVDVSIAFTHLILAARAEGLGTCWIGAFNNSEVKKILGVSEDYNVVAVTPLGYPKGQPFTEPKGRKAQQKSHQQTDSKTQPNPLHQQPRNLDCSFTEVCNNFS